MAVFQKFNCFVEDLAENSHKLDTDTLRALLTNTSPNAADVRVDTLDATCTVEATSNAAEIAEGNGYTKKGPDLTVSASSQTGGTYKIVIADKIITASGGSIGPFRYVVIYNDSTKTTATRPPIAWYDYGSSITLNNGETFTIDFDDTNGFFTLA